MAALEVLGHRRDEAAVETRSRSRRGRDGAGEVQIEEILGLVRWHHPRPGPLLPDVFLPIAEQVGLMHGTDPRGARALKEVRRVGDDERSQAAPSSSQAGPGRAPVSAATPTTRAGSSRSDRG